MLEHGQSSSSNRNARAPRSLAHRCVRPPSAANTSSIMCASCSTPCIASSSAPSSCSSSSSSAAGRCCPSCGESMLAVAPPPPETRAPAARAAAAGGVAFWSGRRCGRAAGCVQWATASAGGPAAGRFESQAQLSQVGLSLCGCCTSRHCCWRDRASVGADGDRQAHVQAVAQRQRRRHSGGATQSSGANWLPHSFLQLRIASERNGVSSPRPHRPQRRAWAPGRSGAAQSLQRGASPLGECSHRPPESAGNAASDAGSACVAPSPRRLRAPLALGRLTARRPCRRPSPVLLQSPRSHSGLG